MHVLIRKFTGQLVITCLLLGTLIPADALAQVKTKAELSNLEEVQEYMRSASEKGSPELEPRLNAAKQVWDAAQAKGLDPQTSAQFAYNIAAITPQENLEGRINAANKMLEHQDLTQSSLPPADRGIVLSRLAQAEESGIAPERQNAMRDIAEEMGPGLSQVRTDQGDIAARARVLDIAMNAVEQGSNPVEAKQRADTLIEISQNLMDQVKDNPDENARRNFVYAGTSAAETALNRGADLAATQRAAEAGSKLGLEGKSEREIEAASLAIANAANAGVSDELISKTGETAAAVAKILSEDGSDQAAYTGARVAGEATTRGVNQIEAAEKGGAVAGMQSGLEERYGSRAASAATSTVESGVLENQENVGVAAVTAAEQAKSAEERGERGQVIDEGARAAGRAVLSGRTVEDSRQIAGVAETATERSLEAGHGRDAAGVAAGTATDVMLSAGRTQQTESSETQPEQREESPAQSPQPEQSEEPPAQSPQPEQREESPAQSSQSLQRMEDELNVLNF